MKIKIDKKIIEAKKCKTILSKARGLMFRKNPEPLVFIFKKPSKTAIHSFFCKPFLAVWIKNGKIVDKRTIKPFSYIKPKQNFTHLIEIPLSKDIKSRRKNRKI